MTQDPPFVTPPAEKCDCSNATEDQRTEPADKTPDAAAPAAEAVGPAQEPCVPEVLEASFPAVQVQTPDELHEEIEDLKRQLASVVATAAMNERIWRHFTEIERILFRTRELGQLAEELLREIKLRFQPDQAILLLCHPDILERFFPDITQESEPIGDGTWILPFPAKIGEELCAGTCRPYLLSEDSMERLLDHLPEAVSSARSGVVIPLCIHNILFGGLFLGSIDPNRYRPSDGTDLLEQLGVKIALCMDNCLAYERVKDFAIQDSLTGLLSFFQIHTVLEREFRKARRNGTPLTALIVDLDFFHDFEGDPEAGNEILKHVADILEEILDGEDCFLGRYGSDEFLVLLPGVQEDEAREVAPYLSQRIRKAPFKLRNTAVLIQAIIGVGTLDDAMTIPQNLLDSAYAELLIHKLRQDDSPF